MKIARQIENNRRKTSLAGRFWTMKIENKHQKHTFFTRNLKIKHTNRMKNTKRWPIFSRIAPFLDENRMNFDDFWKKMADILGFMADKNEKHRSRGPILLLESKIKCPFSRNIKKYRPMKMKITRFWTMKIENKHQKHTFHTKIISIKTKKSAHFRISHENIGP